MKKFKFIALVVVCSSAMSSWALSEVVVSEDSGPYGNTSTEITYTCCYTGKTNPVADWKREAECPNGSEKPTACTIQQLRKHTFEPIITSK